jgi:hypothetical protein
MSWTANVVAAVKRIVLIEERISSLSAESKSLMDVCKDLDRRLLRIEAKFELIERLATTSPRPVPRRKPRLPSPAEEK